MGKLVCLKIWPPPNLHGLCRGQWRGNSYDKRNNNTDRDNGYDNYSHSSSFNSGNKSFNMGKKLVDKSFLVKVTPRDTYQCDIHGVALQRLRSGFNGEVMAEYKKGIVEVDPMQLLGVLAGLLVGFLLIPYAMVRTVLFGLNRWWFNLAMRVVTKKKGKPSAFRAWLFRKL